MRRSAAAAVHSKSFQFKNVQNHFDFWALKKIPYWSILMIIQVGASKSVKMLLVFRSG